MNANTSDDAVLERYLLGSLAPDVRERIEERLLSDDKIFLEHLCLVEDELIESYVEDQLDREETEQFERCFLCTDERRSKVEFARALKAYVEAQPPVRKTVWRRLQTAVPVPTWAVAAAVALLIVLPASFQYFSAPAGRGEVGVTYVSATLSTGLVRGAADELPRVRLSPGCKLVRLNLEPSDEYPIYRATLHEAAGDEIWSQARLSRAEIGGRSAVTLTLPCELLPAGDYYVTLEGVSPRQDALPAGKGNFRVLRP